jgi:hypothetical protein
VDFVGLTGGSAHLPRRLRCAASLSPLLLMMEAMVRRLCRSRQAMEQLPLLGTTSQFILQFRQECALEKLTACLEMTAQTYRSRPYRKRWSGRMYEETAGVLDTNLNFEDMDFSGALQYANNLTQPQIQPSSSMLPSAVVGETDACKSYPPQRKMWSQCANRL